MVSQLSSNLYNGFDAVFAFNIEWHVIQGYRYLINNYKAGDKVFLFGFSRGSFVARILAGMIEKIGLLDQGLESMVFTAWEIYSTWEQEGQPMDELDPTKCRFSVKNFKQTFCRDNVIIEFMGLFDSVNSCGWIRDKLFPYTSNTSHVNHIRHAVSIHERRSKFKQNLFKPFSYLPSMMSSESPITFTPIYTDDRNAMGNFTNRSNDLIEMWFPGDHSDIGGNWNADSNGDALSDLSLRWILSFALDFDVLFKPGSINEYIEKYKSIYSALAIQHDMLSFQKSSVPDLVNPYCIQGTSLFPEPESDRKDIIIDDHFDSFGGHGSYTTLSTLAWWVLEIFPIGYLVENTYGRWRNIYWPNFGSWRTVPDNVKVHWSVLWRIKFITGFNINNLPDIYHQLNSIVNDEEQFPPDVIFELEDLVDLKLGLIKSDEIKTLIDKSNNGHKIGFNIDWLTPPNELEIVNNKF